MKHRVELGNEVDEQGNTIDFICEFGISGQNEYNSVKNNDNRDSNSGNVSVARLIGLDD